MLAAGSVILLSGAVQKQSAMITEGLKGAVKGDHAATTLPVGSSECKLMHIIPPSPFMFPV